MSLAADGSRIMVSRIAQVMANAAVVMVVAHALGPTGQGHYSLTVALTLLAASLLGGGMGLAAVPALRQGRIRPERMMQAQALWVALMVLLLSGLAVATLGSGWAGWLRAHLGWPGGLGWLAAIGAVGMLGFEIFSYNLLARGRLVVGSLINGLRAVGHLAVIGLLALYSDVTFVGAVGAFAAAQLLGMVAIVVVTLRDVRRPRALPEPGVTVRTADGEVPDDLDRRSLAGLILHNVRRGWLGQMSAVAYFLLLRLDQGLLEHFRGAAEVGIYSLAVYVGELLWLVPGALTPLLVHSSAADASDPRRDRTAARAVRLGLGLTLIAALPLYFLAGPLLAAFAGGQYAASGESLRALLPGIVAFAPGAVLAGDFIGRGRPHWNTQASALTVVVNIAIAMYLIPAYGAVGAAWSSSLAYACGSLMMLLRFRHATGLTLADILVGRDARPT